MRFFSILNVKKFAKYCSKKNHEVVLEHFLYIHEVFFQFLNVKKFAKYCSKEITK